MRILNVTHSINPAAGGTVEFIIQCSLALIKAGHCAEVLSLDAPGCEFSKKLGITNYCVGPGFLKYGYCQALLPWLRQHSVSYDAVIVHGIWQYNSLGVWLALRHSSIPYFVFPHGMLDPWFNRTYPLKHLKKLPYWWMGESRVLEDARAVLFTCEEERLLARQSFSKYKCNEMVVSFGTSDPICERDSQRIAFVDCFPQLAGKRYLLYLGRIHQKKGCDLLLHAFSAAGNDRELLLVMAGPDQVGWRADLERLAKRLNIDSRVIWTGMLAGDQKWGALIGAEAFVLPSHQENFGIAVAEAMACGVPVLISNKVNIWREIQADGAGLISEDSIEGVTALLSMWLKLTPNERAKMAKLARDCFLQRFEIHKVAESLLEALNKCGVGAHNDLLAKQKGIPCPEQV